MGYSRQYEIVFLIEMSNSYCQKIKGRWIDDEIVLVENVNQL